MTSGDIVAFPGTRIEVDTQVDDSIRALGYLGLAPNPEQIKKSLTVEVSALLADSPYPGEPYIQLPRKTLSLGDLVNALYKIDLPEDNADSLKNYTQDTLWTPGYSNISYTEDELDALYNGGSNSFSAHARLAMHNATPTTDQLLHFTNMPFDQESAKDNKTSQLEALEELRQSNNNLALEINPLNAKGLVFIAIQRALAKREPPLDKGIMIDATLPKKEVYYGKYYIGSAEMVDGRMALSSRFGHPRRNVGIGISIGPSLTRRQDAA